MPKTSAPLVVVVASEKGGVGKTTLVGLVAAAACRAGLRVTAIDLDPRATLTEMTQAEFPTGYSVDAILAADDPTGWATQLQVPSPWFDTLSIVPSERGLANREKSPADHAEHRLAMALDGLDTDLIIVDTPPRAGGVLVLSALALRRAHVLYAATADQDGLDGVAQSWRTVDAARRWTNPQLDTAGIAVTRVDLRTVDARRCLNELADIYPDLLLQPHFPERVVIREARAACEPVGNYDTDLADRGDQLWTNLHTRLTAAT